MQGSDGVTVTLADIPFENIRVGDRCRSLRETLGTIIVFIPGQNTGKENGYIEIQWENGCTSKDYVFRSGVPWIGRVEYLGQPIANNV